MFPKKMNSYFNTYIDRKKVSSQSFLSLNDSLKAKFEFFVPKLGNNSFGFFKEK